MMLFQPSGSFISFAYRYIDPAWAFAVGWIYIFHCIATIPLDIIVAAKVMVTVLPSVNLVVWLSTLIVAISTIVLSRLTYLVQISMTLGLVKLIVIAGIGSVIKLLFCCKLSIDFDPGSSQYLLPVTRGCHQSTNRSSIGRILVHSMAASLAAPQLFSSPVPIPADSIYSALEPVNQTLRLTTSIRALRVVFWALTIVRIFTIVTAGVEVPFTDLRLLNSTSDYGVSASPLVISTAAHAAAPILLVVLRTCSAVVQLSMALSAVFGASEALLALAEHEQAPVIFALRDSKGRLVFALLIGALLTFLGYLALSELSETFLIYAVDAGGLPILFIHLTIFVAHARFRRGLHKQKRDISGADYRCSTGLPGSYFGIVFSLIVVFCQLWTALAPTDYSLVLSVEIIGISFASYIYLPVLLCLYGSYKIRHQTRWRKSTEIDYTVL